ncbi:MAG: hypothetical protein J1F07_02420 [Muribaculaceae bacterium]|nr:hypothetical protein [Muribaculaceae bacterium]
MGFFKKIAQKAQDLNEKFNSEGGLIDKVKELQEVISDEEVDAVTKCKAAGQFIKNLGTLRNGNPESASESTIFVGPDLDSLDDVEDDEGKTGCLNEDGSEDREISDEYKQWFKERYGISYEEHMASIMENAGKPLDDETIDFIRNLGKD